jgi:hypothetical protein
LYQRLSQHPELRTVTAGEGCRGARLELNSMFPGSWIDANFYIWIGHPDDHRAWSQLTEARRALDLAEGADRSAAARAREEVLIAEGSDWFWWYGDDHSSEHDAEFDDLFRRHLRNVYRLLQRPVPDELFASNISARAQEASETSPTGLISPTLDGEDTSYFEWLGAGRVEVRDAAGAMHQTGLISEIWFGFDRERLYVRLDGVRSLKELLAEGYEFSLHFLKPAGLRLAVSQRAGAPTSVESAVAGSILEMAVPLMALDAAGGLAFFVAVQDAHGTELERHPASHPMEIQGLDAGFEARNWTA